MPTYEEVLDALGDGTRRRIMGLLRSSPRAVGEITGELAISQPAVSQHLKVLRRAGLVSVRPAGTRRVYQLAPEGLAELQAYLEEFWNQALNDLKAAAESGTRTKSMAEAEPAVPAVEQTIRIKAPREQVFALLSDRALINRWMPATVFEPRIGGRVEFAPQHFVAAGEVIELDPPSLIAYSWDWRDQPLGAPTVVRFVLEEGAEGTVVRLTHRGFQDPARWENHRRGWDHYGGRLKVVAEGSDPGPDRFSVP